MPSYGELVAERLNDVYVGSDGYTFMEPYGSNSGPKVNEWHRVWGWSCCQPWCGICEAGVAREVPGAWGAYGGSNFLSPSVAQIEANGRRLGWQWRGGRIPIGAVATYGGSVHTNFVLIDHGPIAGGFTAVGGNESNGVKRSERSSYASRLWVPPGILKGPTPPRPVVPTDPNEMYDFALEDPRAKQFVLRSYFDKAKRDRVLRDLTKPGSPYNKFHPRPHMRMVGGRPKYFIIGGPIKIYGPYDKKAQQNRAKNLLAPKLRERYGLPVGTVVLRPYRVKEKEYAAALAELREWLDKYGND